MFKKILSNKHFYNLAGSCLPYLVIACAFISSFALLNGLIVAPIDYQQLDAVRIIYIHVPSAILSLAIYTIIGISSALYLIYGLKIADLMAINSAKIGIVFTALALITGSIWAKPIWGAWWVWDARLTSELILFFLYCGYLGLRLAITNQKISAKIGAILAVVGLIDVPLVHFSVNWWNTLHQGASISKFAKPSISIGILYPLVCSLIGMFLLYIIILFVYMRADIIWQERNTAWINSVAF